jgi:hypothetical protein
MLESIATPEFKALTDKLYKNHENGFYVNAPPVKNFSSGGVNYIVRYTGRPALAQSRITDYDGEFVTFNYTPHGSDELVYERLSAFEFIKKLIIHIPDKNFKMIRYYGFYSIRSSKHEQYLRRAKKMDPSIREALRKNYKSWRRRIFASFLYDPIKCYCGTFMERIQIFTNTGAIEFYLSFTRCHENYNTS